MTNQQNTKLQLVELMAKSFVLLAILPKDFWSMTLTELSVIWQEKFTKNIDVKSSDLEDLIKKFPDKI